jgi:hypothetical protein
MSSHESVEQVVRVENVERPHPRCLASIPADIEEILKEFHAE